MGGTGKALPVVVVATAHDGLKKGFGGTDGKGVTGGKGWLVHTGRNAWSVIGIGHFLSDQF